LVIEKRSTEKYYVSLCGCRMWKACFCKECGTLCYGLFEDEAKQYAVIRARTFDDISLDLKKTVVTDFEGEEKSVGRERRKNRWTPVDLKSQ
jgi:hypothetical protein